LKKEIIKISSFLNGSSSFRIKISEKLLFEQVFFKKRGTNFGIFYDLEGFSTQIQATSFIFSIEKENDIIQLISTLIEGLKGYD